MTALEGIIDGAAAFGRGRKAKALRVGDVRELSAEDLVQASLNREDLPTKAPPLQALRQSHHTLARLLAQGERPVNISIITGVSQSRISILKADPSFQQLLATYEDMEKSGFETARVDMHKRLAALGYDAIETLHAKLEEDPAAFSNKELLAIVEASADRTGFGKTSTVNHNHDHSLSDETLAAIRAAGTNGSADGQAREVAEEDRRALLCLAHRATEVYSGGEEAEFSPSEGGGLREQGGEGTEETATAVHPLAVD